MLFRGAEICLEVVGRGVAAYCPQAGAIGEMSGFFLCKIPAQGCAGGDGVDSAVGLGIANLFTTRGLFPAESFRPTSSDQHIFFFM